MERDELIKAMADIEMAGALAPDPIMGLPSGTRKRVGVFSAPWSLVQEFSPYLEGDALDIGGGGGRWEMARPDLEWTIVEPLKPLAYWLALAFPNASVHQLTFAEFLRQYPDTVFDSCVSFGPPLQVSRGHPAVVEFMREMRTKVMLNNLPAIHAALAIRRCGTLIYVMRGRDEELVRRWIPASCKEMKRREFSMPLSPRTTMAGKVNDMVAVVLKGGTE